jgi:stage II sporulation protein M
MRFGFWVLIAAGLFITGIWAGIVIHAAMPAVMAGFLSEQSDALANIGSSLGTFHIGTLVFIYLKNALALMVSFLFSPLLCLVPILALLFNSALVSYVGAAVVQEKSLGYLLAGVLPHGIFEIPAFIIGEAAALSFGVAAIISLFSRGRGDYLRENFGRNFRYLLLALALLAPAAIIETFVTPLLIS